MDALNAQNTSLALFEAAQTGRAASALALQEAAASKDMWKIEEAAQEFEAVFIAEMMKPMFEGISTAPPFGGGRGEEVFRSLLLQEYGKTMARTRSIGIADQVKAYLLQTQESADAANILPTQSKEIVNHETGRNHDQP